MQKIDIPAVETTACAFGGEQLDRLFVTTGLKKDLDEPKAGKVFVIDGLDGGSDEIAVAGDDHSVVVGVDVPGFVESLVGQADESAPSTPVLPAQPEADACHS